MRTFSKINEIPPSAYLPPEIVSNINVNKNMHPNNAPMQYNQQNSLESSNQQFYNQQQIVVQPTNENMLPPNKYLKHNSSEPNLFGSNQQISIINSVPNQIMIRSSFSDQNFPNNNNHQPRIYQQNTIVGSDGGSCSITNQSYFNGSKNQMIVKSNSNSITCVNNQFTPINNFIEESPNEYDIELIPEIDTSSRHSSTSNTNKPKRDKISRSHSLISDDRIIDIEYDSDTGWVTKNVRPNKFVVRKGCKTDESCSDREFSKINPKINKRNADKLGSDHKINKSLELDRDDEPNEREFKISKHNFNKIINDQNSYDRISSSQRLDRSSEKLNRRKHQSKSPKRSRKSLSNCKSSSDSLSDVDHKSRRSLKNVVDHKKYSVHSSRKYREERAIGYENSTDDEFLKKRPAKVSSSESDYDDVPFTRGRTSSYHGRPNNLRRDKRRTSSLEGINSFVARRVDQNRSSVSINETPEYFEYDKSPVTPPTNKINASASSIANHASNFSNSINHVALPKSKPKSGSLKKSTPNTTSKPTKKSTPKITPKSSPKTFKKSSKKSSSEYDVSDRRRPTGNGGNTRESFRDRDQLSDRDQRDSRGSSFNRSLSNAEGTPEDKIGEFFLLS